MAREKSQTIRIYNASKQMIPLQLRAPGGDFFTNEQQVRIMPGKDVLLPKSHLRSEQVDNLRRRGMIKVVYDSEDAVPQEALLNS